MAVKVRFIEGFVDGTETKLAALMSSPVVDDCVGSAVMRERLTLASS